ncbi:MAG: FecR family protein [Leptospiraceae bacterium]|nr:FecR family protein [Leptospiraceae bacterium]
MEYLHEPISKRTAEEDKTRILILLLLLLILFFSFLLYRNITQKGREGDNPVIGVLTFKNRIVERKVDEEVIWDRVESGVQIRNKDTIRSAEFSDGVLTLNDGTKILLSENSMVYLDFSDGIHLDFAYGSMSVEGGNARNLPIKITSSDKTIEIQQGNLKLEKTSKEELKLEVKEGKAKVKTGNEEKEIKKDEVAKVDNKKVVVEEANFKLINPPEIFVTSTKAQTASIDFSWSVNSVVTKTNLELSYDSKFRKIFQSIPVQGNSISLNLKPGNYYWRITGEHSQKKQREFSSFHKIQILAKSTPKLVTPKENQSFTYLQKPPIINFAWTSSDGVKNYKLEISNSSNFSSILKTVTTTQTFAGIEGLENGKYFARVVTEYQLDNSTEISPVLSFATLQKKDPEPPTLTNPFLTWNELILNKKGYNLYWTDSPDFKSYTLQIASDESFQNLIISEKLNLNQKHVTLSAKNLSMLYWRVAGITQDGTTSNYSKVGKIQIQKIEAIQLVTPLDGQDFELEDEVQFQWKKVDVSPNFLWELSSNPSFTDLISKEKLQSYFLAKNFQEAGKYYWRVTLLDEDGNVLVTSKPSSFILKEIEPPSPVFPNYNQRVDMAKKDFLEFQWKADKKFSTFLIELYASNGKLLFKQKTNRTRYEFDDLSKLDEGEFFWKLAGYLNDGKILTPKQNKIPFSIYLSVKPTAPQLKTPKKFYIEE